MGEVRTKPGCRTAAIIVGVLVLLLIPVAFVVPALFYTRVQSEHAVETRMAERSILAHNAPGTGQGVVFEENAIPRFAPHQRGEALQREQFVAMMIDDLATELARKEFQTSANGASVSWLLQTGDISEPDAGLRGQFTLPYQLRSGRSSHGSAITLDCEFLPETKNDLLLVRKGEWVVVEGTLSFDGRKVSIKEARIGGGKAAPRAERPEP